MAPAFDSRSAGKSAFVSRIAANRLRAKAACHASSGMDAVPCGEPVRAARVVHEDVEAAEGFERSGGYGLHPGDGGDIARDERGADGQGLTTRARRHHDLRAGVEQALRDRRADAAGASGDERTMADEFLGEVELVGHEIPFVEGDDRSAAYCRRRKLRSRFISRTGPRP